jgi:putative phage-type endonuclease
MDKQSWLNWRKAGIGASDAIVLMGEAPKEWGNNGGINTPYKLWLAKTKDYVAPDNFAMARGRAHEQDALAWLETAIGAEFESQKTCEHPVKNWMRATLDGISKDKSISCEVKVCKKEIFDQIKNGEIPRLYKPQVLHQMEVLPTQHHFLSAYNPDYKEGAYVEVKRDDFYIKQMMEVEENFWIDHVCCLEAPDLHEWDYVDMEYSEPWIVDSTALKTRADEFDRARDVLEEEKQIKDRLKKLCPDFCATGNGVTMKRSKIDGAIDYKSMPKDLQEVVKKYRKPSSLRYSFYIS